MNDNTPYEYPEELEIAKANLADFKKRGAEAIGANWDDFVKEHFTPEEIAASDVRVALMTALTHARHERKLSQRGLEELCGVKQPVIARIENGTVSPQLDTVLKILAPLGKTLAVVDIAQT